MFVYIEKTRTGSVPCVFGYTGCTAVTTGPYSHIGPLDLSLLGAAAYITILLLAVVKGTAVDWRLVTGIAWILLAMTLFGVSFSWYLQWEAKYIIKEFCIYCRTSACIMTGLFIASVADLVVNGRRRGTGIPQESTDNSVQPI
jgi:uncharacterized membrane protein